MTRHMRLMALGMLFVLLGTTAAFADGHDKGKASMKDMFFKKVKLIYYNQEELNVSDEQLDKIKEVKVALKKEKIRKEADIDLVKIDIWMEMQKDTVDQAAVDKLIDQKYGLKSELAKKTAASCVALKGILSQDQQEAVKKMIMEKRSGDDHGKKSDCGCKRKGK